MAQSTRNTNFSPIFELPMWESIIGLNTGVLLGEWCVFHGLSILPRFRPLQSEPQGRGGRNDENHAQNDEGQNYRAGWHTDGTPTKKVGLRGVILSVGRVAVVLLVGRGRGRRGRVCGRLGVAEPKVSTLTVRGGDGASQGHQGLVPFKVMVPWKKVKVSFT